MELPEIERVESLSDLIDFLESLSRHFEQGRRGDDWQHWYVGDYLEAMAAWLRATPALAHVRDEKRAHIEGERPTWRGVAIMFDAARVYE